MARVDYLKAFEEDCHVRGMTLETTRRYASSLGIYRQFMGRKHLDKADRETLREFLSYLREERKVSQKTIENYFSALSSFYAYLEYEDIITRNPIPNFRTRYIRSYKEKVQDTIEKRVLSVNEMSILINATTNTRDKAILVLLAKTGIRRGELISIDIDDVDWRVLSITLKPKAKRSNRTVFFDDECSRILRQWTADRESWNPDPNALFVNKDGGRLQRQGIYRTITHWARVAGINDTDAREGNISPHSFRHFFTTHLVRNGMPRELVKELRGDARREAIDLYYHVDLEDLRRRYLACIPQMGV